jgi:hypothetical protein
MSEIKQYNDAKLQHADEPQQDKQKYIHVHTCIQFNEMKCKNSNLLMNPPSVLGNNSADLALITGLKVQF